MSQILIGHTAPNFTAPAVLSNGELVDNFHLHQVIREKYALIFFYPLDFTFVCPSELIALNKRMDEFKKRNIEVIAISIDSHYTHLAWRNTPIQKGGIGPIQYPLVADVDHKITQSYGIEHTSAHVALRAAFMIDPQGIVRSEIVNDLPIGRSVDEILRLFDAIEFVNKYGEVCPANWEKGQPGIQPTPEGVAQYLSEKERTGS